MPYRTRFQSDLRACLGVFLLLALAGPQGAKAQLLPPLEDGSCWTSPQPETVDEAIAVARNGQSRGAWRTRLTGASERVALALSGGAHRAAHGGGVLIGWTETGVRPDFHIVTAVDTSAIIAPFAFLGIAGDRDIAALFNCDFNGWRAVAERAATALTAERIAAIAAKHARGGRLIVALSGSPARPELALDIGAIAAEDPEAAGERIRAVLMAAADPLIAFDGSALPKSAVTRLDRNWSHRRVGTGEAFLPPGFAGGGVTRFYLIHNGVLGEQSDDYIAAQERGGVKASAKRQLGPLYDVMRDAERAQVSVAVASVRAGGAPPVSPFDTVYMKALFLRSFRQARMGSAWIPYRR